MQQRTGHALGSTQSQGVLCDGDPGNDLAGQLLLQLQIHLGTLGGIGLAGSGVDQRVNFGISQVGVVAAALGVDGIAEHVVGVLAGCPRADIHLHTAGGTVAGKFFDQRGLLHVLHGDGDAVLGHLALEVLCHFHTVAGVGGD